MGDVKIVPPAADGKFRALQEELTRAHSAQTSALTALRRAHLAERNTLADMLLMARRHPGLMPSVRRLIETYGDEKLLSELKKSIA